MAVCQYQVRPTILVDIQKSYAPPEQLIHAEPTRLRYVLEETAVLITIERRPVAGKVSLRDIQEAVPIKIRDRHAHSRLKLAIDVVSDAHLVATLVKCAVVIVMVQQTGRLIAS